MLFIREYTAKSLDRSSVSMIDKYNTRLDKVGELLNELSSLIDNLLSLIKDIRTLLGQSKQRIYNNLDQVKEVIDGNGITGTESTIEAIESALEAGDKAIDEAEAKLEGIEAAIECSEAYCNDTNVDVVCGETVEACNENPANNEDCTFCTYGNQEVICSGGYSIDDIYVCALCNHDRCVVEISCNEPASIGNYDPKCDQYWGGVPNPDPTVDQCPLQAVYDPNCSEGLTKDTECSQYTCIHSDGCAQQIPGNCSYDCTHSTECSQSPMPEDCTYTCVDNGCAYEGTDCSYGTVCGQEESCNQYDCSEYDCGEICGETCHMTDDEGDCSEGSCGEDDGNDDGPCNQYDCSEYDCGEPCGESCGLL